MRSPYEYEATFYADTINANLDTTIKVGNSESSLQLTGRPSVRHAVLVMLDKVVGVDWRADDARPPAAPFPWDWGGWWW
jgi:hypothetical protein